jgi:hypothetical protein
MSDAGGNGSSHDSPAVSKAGGAPKDRSCPYCHQAFTSSSLGRHLDLYIKEKNPKPPDGIHDVDAIRKMRASITRRQPRGSLAKRHSSTPDTPAGSSVPKSPSVDSSLRRPPIPKEGQYVVDQVSRIFQPSWEATGVINDIPPRSGISTGNWDASTSPPEEVRMTSMQQLQQQRVPSRLAQKQQLDVRQKLADAVDTARAAELALREVLSSWRAAKSVYTTCNILHGNVAYKRQR